MMDYDKGANQLADARADGLAELLDRSLPPHSDQILENRAQNPLVDAAVRLSAAPTPTLSPEAFARIEAQIMQARPAPSITRPRFSAPAVAAALLVMMVLVGALVLALRPPDDPTAVVIVASATASPTAAADTSMPPTDAASVGTLSSTETPDPTSTGTAVRELSPTMVSTMVSTTATPLPATQEVRAPSATLTPTLSPPTLAPLTVTLVSMTVTPLGVTITPGAGDGTAAATLAAPTQAVTIILEGPIEAITDNTLQIYGIDVRVDAANPLLKVLRVEDYVRIEGDVIGSGETLIVIVLTLTLENPDPSANEFYIQPGTDNIWRDPGDCSSPPPSWAAADNWRRRCEIRPPAGGNSGGGTGGGSGGSGGNGSGGGNSDDDDDDDGGDDDD